jgi:predicted RNA binding protein YcfA (HicA-like mRNA interferase family)
MSDKVEEVILILQQRKTNLCCEEVKNLLQSLGFIVRDGKNGGHKIFVHPKITGFFSGSFNCGHGKNPEIKPSYISGIIKILKQYKGELNHDD